MHTIYKSENKVKMLKTISGILKRILLSIIILFVIFIMLFISPGKVYSDPTADLIISYDFNVNILDSLNGSILNTFGISNDGYNHNNDTSGFNIDSGIGGDTTFWEWTSTLDRGGGFWIDVNSSISSNYSVGVRFAFNQTGPSWRKIIDYQNMATDDGFYFNSGKLKFYPIAGEGTNVINNGDIVDVIATRNSATNKFTAYFVVNGTLNKELEVDDTSNLACPILIGGKTRFGFFFDDIATSTEATNGGKVYSVKIWNGPITQLQAETAMDPEETQAPLNTSRPLTKEEIVMLNLTMSQQVDHYGATPNGFVEMLYDNSLSRVYDSQGYNNWVGELAANTMTGSQVAYHFIFSEELAPTINSLSDNDLIEFLYRTLLNRLYEPAGYMNWQMQMQLGMTREELVNHFTTSPEFAGICTFFNVAP